MGANHFLNIVFLKEPLFECSNADLNPVGIIIKREVPTATCIMID